jgi:hypothetical protein
LDGISRHQWLPDDPAHRARQHFQMFRFNLFRFTEVFRDRAGDDIMNSQRNRVAANAIDPEREIEQGTQRGHKPDDANPQRRSPRIAFVEQGMQGSQDSSQDANDAQMGPKPGECFKAMHLPKTLLDATARCEHFKNPVRLFLKSFSLLLLLILIFPAIGA